MDNPYEWLQSAIDQVPDILQPVIVALAGTIPYIEGEGAAAFGILAGIHPVVAAIAGAAGNILCVVAVVLLGSRIREAVVARRARSSRTTAPRAATTHTALVAESTVDESTVDAGGASSPSTTTITTEVGPLDEQPVEADAKPTRRAKGRAKLRTWMVRFGVPSASLLAPLALPTMLTAAFFVSTGVGKQWVILWQVVAIALWTTLVAVAATGALALLGW